MFAKPAVTLSVLFLVLVVILGILANRQNERDYSLSEAVSNRNYARAEQLLKEGANPDAPWSGYELKHRIPMLMGKDPWDGKPIGRSYNLVNYSSDPKMKALLLKYGAKP